MTVTDELRVNVCLQKLTWSDYNVSDKKNDRLSRRVLDYEYKAEDKKYDPDWYSLAKWLTLLEANELSATR